MPIPNSRVHGYEPQAYSVTTSDVEAAIVSTALSLKRIADTLAKVLDAIKQVDHTS